ncbi:SDR family oxidoreductase [Rhizobium hainanense]|uniref:NAD(P)-dependent dehydrogenase, short-chain alcohol dehydrogenase family n=1 Tax=Rhizobium hainanense TaxID=52131 RepID=A0A1C3V6S3_9HYPH|nr:SDR family oxidoreductase [Rhizobium hainanense]SCB23307.1 NAD(P)-dependent dehydrogenase, short-chain alcohol dehydrogenase family [Rhizobium hainanense]
MTDDAPVLLVTGGSRGIGAAVCLAAAQHGWAVAVNYASNKDAAEAVVGTIVDAGGEAIAIAGDVGKPEDIKAIFAKVDAHFGRIDGLVNNAGIVDSVQRVDEMTSERLDRMFRINVTGSILCAGQAVLRMSTRHGGKGGVIVNVSSMAAILGSAGQYVDYAASKAAIDTFTLGLAREVATEGIRVNAVRPGIIDTDIHASGGLPDRARDMSPLIPMQRPGTADEVADAILYLLSPHASYITGSILNVSGGR